MSLYGVLKSQNLDTAPWCPPGATWVYGLYNSGLNNGDYLSVKFEKDTIVSGKNVKKLIVKIIDYYSINPPQGRIETDFSIEYEYVSNDSLFYYDTVRDSFLIKYDFEARNGDFLEVNKHATECSNPTYQSFFITSILSTGFDTLNNLIFPSIVFDDNLNSSAYLVGKVLKNIGSLNYFYPTINANQCSNPFPEYTSGLLYYSDSERGILFSTSHPIQNILSTENFDSDIQNNIIGISVFPNPSQNMLHLEMSSTRSNLQTYKIFNIYGQLIKYGNLENNQINVQEIPDGSYILALFDISNYRFTAKFTKKQE